MKLTMHAVNKRAHVLQELTDTLATGPQEHCKRVLDDTLAELIKRINDNGDDYVDYPTDTGHVVSVGTETITYEVV